MDIIPATAEDYKQAMISLAPQGICWPREDDANWVKLWDALAQEFARINDRFNDLYNEAFPDTTTELIGDWERIVGLPDAFSDPDATLEERRAAVLFKLRARGGQSAEYIESLIEALGYPAKVYDTPFAAGVSRSGNFIFDDSWVNFFFVLIGGPVTDLANLEARIRSIQPAHVQSIFYVEEP